MAKGLFESVLDRKSSAIEAPKPLPIGTYHCMVFGEPREDKSSKKGTPFVEFTLKLVGAADDVDEDALETYLHRKSGENKSLNDVTIKDTYYLTDDAAFHLVQFLDNCEAGDEDMSLRQRIAETANKEILVRIIHQPSDDGLSVFARIKSTAKVS